MCYILILSYLSAPSFSPICTHFEGVLISHSVPSTSRSQSGSNISPKIQSFLSPVIRSHIPFLGLEIVWTLIIKPSTALRRKFLSLQSLYKNDKGYLFINEQAGRSKFQTVNYKTYCYCLQCTVAVKTAWYFINADVCNFLIMSEDSIG